MMTLADLAAQHLTLRLRPLARALRAAADRQARLAAKLIRPDVTPLCVTDEQVDVLLAAVSSGPTLHAGTVEWTLDEQEAALETTLRGNAAENNTVLPLDRLEQQLGLTEMELRALLVCVAPEFERAYERIYAYILDDLNRKFPCIELATILCADDLPSQMRQRALLGPLGKLRRLGVIDAIGEASTELRRQLRCGPGLIEFLASAHPGYIESRRDNESVLWATRQILPNPEAKASVERIGEQLRIGNVDCVGIWGGESRGVQAALQLLCERAERTLRRPTFNSASSPATLADELRGSLTRAAALRTCLWIDLDGVDPPLLREIQRIVDAEAIRRSTPIVLTATHPWRSLAVLQCRRYLEYTLPDLEIDDRRVLMTEVLSEGSGSLADDLAEHYRLGPAEAAALGNLVRNASSDDSNQTSTSESIEAAAMLVTRRATSSFAVVLKPDRQPEELILPATLHDEVLQVADFYRAWSRVRHDWNLGRLGNPGGMKAMFTGDSGTGKTLAAEVVATRLEMPLMKVDLSQVVSRWVGETEQQLDCLFREADELRAVLFFDEADALFGKRGEVKHGVDRYANMEVSYLLQKLEDPSFHGLVLCATNLKDNIDTAFVRRFHFVLNFPRPAEEDRKRIWRSALPPKVPLAADVDLDVFARLDMTGASIVSAVRTAALLAASSSEQEIGSAHIVSGVRRQFRHEARMLLDSDFNPKGSRDGATH
jgi:AAA+ superfamily predicted ATPase